MTNGPSAQSKSGGRGATKGKTKQQTPTHNRLISSFFGKGDTESSSATRDKQGTSSPASDIHEGARPHEQGAGVTSPGPVAMEVEGEATPRPAAQKSRGKPLANKRDRVAAKKADIKPSEDKGPVEDDDDDEVVVVEVVTKAAAEAQPETAETPQEEEAEASAMEGVEAVTSEEPVDAEEEPTEAETAQDDDAAQPATTAVDEEAAVEQEQEGEVQEGAEEEGAAAEAAAMEVEQPEETAATAEDPAAAAPVARPAPKTTPGKGKRAKSKKSAGDSGAPPAPESELEKKYREQLEALVASTSQALEEQEADDHHLGVDELLEAARACELPEDEAADMPEPLVRLIARLIQGSHLPLQALSDGVLLFLSEGLVPCVERLSKQAIQDKIRLIAERKCYGIKPKAAVVAEDESVQALWRWEVAELQHLPETAKGVVREVRAERQNLGKLFKCLAKLIEVIRKDPSDAAAISQNETKLFDAHRDVEKLKKKKEERLKKEQDKAKREEEKAEKARQKEEAKAQKEHKKEEKEKRKRESAGATGEEGEGGAASAKKKAAVEKAPPKPPGVSLFKFFAKKPADAKPSASTSGSGGAGAASSTTAGGESEATPMEVEPDNSLIEEMDRQLKLGLSHDEVLGLLRDKAQAATGARNPKRKPHRFVTLSVTVTKRSGDGIWDGPDYCELEEKRLWNCIKFFKFAEDVRPPYRGTWSKRSRCVSGRHPFGQDRRVLDYDYDSEEDWEEGDAEGDVGENLSVTAEDDEKDADDGLDYTDGWLAKDNDLGLSDDEDREDGGAGGPSDDKEVVRFGTLFFDADFNTDKPIVDDRIRATWDQFRVLVLDDAAPIQLAWSDAEDVPAGPLQPVSSEDAAEAKDAAAAGTGGPAAAGGAAATQPGSKKAPGRAPRVVSRELMPALIKLVDKNRDGLDNLTKAFLDAHPGAASKVQVRSIIKEIAERLPTLTGGKAYIVKKSVLLEYGLAQEDEQDAEAAGQPQQQEEEHAAPADDAKCKGKAAPELLKGQKGLDAFFPSDGQSPKKKASEETRTVEGASGPVTAAESNAAAAVEPMDVDGGSDEPQRAFRGDNSKGWEEAKVSEK